MQLKRTYRYSSSCYRFYAYPIAFLKPLHKLKVFPLNIQGISDIFQQNHRIFPLQPIGQKKNPAKEISFAGSI